MAITASCTASKVDRFAPLGRIVEGRRGALYGTAVTGGGTNVYPGFGTIFKLNKNGSGFAVLHTFGEIGNDGYWPYAGLVQGSDHAFYGTTSAGGEFGFGTVFRNFTQ
jgi:uncharacterized repeat protein (TIGR03803 family)